MTLSKDKSGGIFFGGHPVKNRGKEEHPNSKFIQAFGSWKRPLSKRKGHENRGRWTLKQGVLRTPHFPTNLGFGLVVNSHWNAEEIRHQNAQAWAWIDLEMGMQ